MLHYFKEKKLHTDFKEHIDNETEYSLIDILGTGSYGVAYLLLSKKTNEKAVLKRLRAKHRNNTKTRSKFAQEIAMMKSINNKRIPSIIAEGQLNEIPFYIMEYVSGQTFEQTIFEENQQYSEKEALNIVRQLLEMIVSLHSMSIVHRDLRIPNILIQNQQLHIIDFGLAAYIKDDIDININAITNPKKAENHYSDLYYTGHFLLYLLYSSYTPMDKKERSWQDELTISTETKNLIERLLLIQPGFSSAAEALETVSQLYNSKQ